MAGTYNDLIVNFVANTDQFISGTMTAASSLDKFTRQYQRLGAIITGGLIGGGLAGSAIAVKTFTANVLAQAGALDDARIRLGTTAREYATLTYAARLAGGSAEEMQKRIDKLNKSIVTAATTGAGKEKFAKLGLDPTEMLNMDTVERWSALAEAAKKVGNQSILSASFMDILGKSGASATQMAIEFSDAMGQAAEVMETLPSDEAIAYLAKLEDRFMRTMERVKHAAMNIVIDAADAYDAMAGNDVSGKYGIFDLKTGKLTTSYDDPRKPKTGKGGRAYVDPAIQEYADSIEADLVTPAQKFTAELEKLNRAAASGAIGEGTYQRQFAKLREELEKTDGVLSATKKLVEEYPDKIQQMAAKLENVNLLGRMNPGMLNEETQDRARNDIAKQFLDQLRNDNPYSADNAVAQYANDVRLITAALQDGKHGWELYGLAMDEATSRMNKGKTDELREYVKGIRELIQTPTEKFESELAKLNNAVLNMSGDFLPSEYMRAKAQLDKNKNESTPEWKDAERFKELVKSPQDEFIEDMRKLGDASKFLDDGVVTAATEKLKENLYANDEKLKSAVELTKTYVDELKEFSDSLALASGNTEWLDKLTQRDYSAMGKQALDMIQGEQNFTPADADNTFGNSAQYQANIEGLNLALMEGRITLVAWGLAASEAFEQFERGRVEDMQQFAVSLQAATQTPLEKFANDMDMLNQALSAGVIQWDLYARGVFDANQELWGLASGAQMASELMGWVQSQFESTRSPYEKFQEHMGKLDQAAAYGMVDPNLYYRSMMQAQGEMMQAMDMKGGMSDMMGGYDMGMMAPPIGAYTQVYPMPGGGAPSTPGTAGMATASQILGVLTSGGVMDTAKQQLAETKRHTYLLERLAFRDGGIML